MFRDLKNGRNFAKKRSGEKQLVQKNYYNVDRSSCKMVSPYQITQQIDTECSNMAQVGHVEQILRQEHYSICARNRNKGLGLFVSHGTSLEIVPLQRASGLLSVYGVVVSSAQHHGQHRCGTQPKFLTTRNARACAGRSPSRPTKQKRSFF